MWVASLHVKFRYLLASCAFYLFFIFTNVVKILLRFQRGTGLNYGVVGKDGGMVNSHLGAHHPAVSAATKRNERFGCVDLLNRVPPSSPTVLNTTTQ